MESGTITAMGNIGGRWSGEVRPSPHPRARESEVVNMEHRAVVGGVS